MQSVVDTLVRNGYLVLFLWVLAAQAGIPLPAIPLLLAAGALAGTGHLDLFTAVALSLLASLLGDSLWFVLGRYRGNRVLSLLCRLSLEPDACVRRTQDSFARNRVLTLVIAKFVPGLSTMAPPLAGMFGMSWLRFLWLDAFGALVWTLTFVLPGYAFADRLETIVEHAAIGGSWLLILLLAIIVVFVLVKVLLRRAFLRQLRVARIEPAELHRRLGAAEPLFLVDLRHTIDFESEPRVIPGALRVPAEQLEQLHAAIPRDRDVVLYCT
ncbi:MAG TPA: VTT domain-containing protein [Planctomycetota bacterium]|nr:VTT domain-containing protein [Planctomycetota bacterium]